MSTNRLTRQKSSTTTNNHEYNKICCEKDPYWDEGISYHNQLNWKKGQKYKQRQITHFQVRMYRSWKHNRKTQWK